MREFLTEQWVLGLLVLMAWLWALLAEWRVRRANRHIDGLRATLQRAGHGLSRVRATVRMTQQEDETICGSLKLLIEKASKQTKSPAAKRRALLRLYLNDHPSVSFRQVARCVDQVLGEN